MNSKLPTQVSGPSAELMTALGDAFQLETAGIIRYMHYSFMIMGHNRIPIQAWFRDQAKESMDHCIAVGEKITSLGGHPPLVTAPVQDTKTHGIDEILRESLSFEQKALDIYKKIVTLAGADIAMEEFARQFVREETEHIEEVQKMLKKEH